MATAVTTGAVRFPLAENVWMQPARTAEHYRGAFELLHQAYCRAGLDEPNRHGMRVTQHQLLPTSQVFVATLEDTVISTLTLVQDASLGLPMEQVYCSEIQRQRERGIRLAEVSCLADRRLSPKRFFELFSALSRLMAQYAVARGVDELWIACHPKHSRLYQRRLAFEPQGGLTDYPAARGNPAVPLRVDLVNLKEDYPAVWRRFFAEPIPPEALAADPLRGEQLGLFRQVAADCQQATEAQRATATVA